MATPPPASPKTNFQLQLEALLAQARADAGLENDILTEVARVLDTYANAKGDLVLCFGHLLARNAMPPPQIRTTPQSSGLSDAEKAEDARWAAARARAHQ